MGISDSIQQQNMSGPGKGGLRKIATGVLYGLLSIHALFTEFN
jgi:hypothetical protein